MQQPAVLIVAQSGRFLAQLAHRAGYSIWVADCFGDQDTLAIADRWLPLADLHDHAAVAKTILDLSQHQPCLLIYGSGIEAFYPALNLLPESINIIGNSAKTIKQVKNPTHFFSLLQQLAIPYPDTSFAADDAQPNRWLSKPICGFGGRLISDQNEQTDSEPYYYQRYINGLNGSVLFLADGHSAQACGFNQQFRRALSDTPFLLSGLSTPLSLSTTLQRRLEDIVNRIVAHSGLRGFNSLDFIVTTDDDVFILEINPRISASVELIDTEQPLFKQHLAACLDQSMSPFSSTPVQRHLHTIFAPCDLITPDFIDWPETYHDRPKAKVLIKNGAPICTVLVETLMSFSQSESETQQRAFSLMGLLENEGA